MGKNIMSLSTLPPNTCLRTFHGHHRIGVNNGLFISSSVYNWACTTLNLISRCAGIMVGHPFDTIKVRIQTQDSLKPLYRGTFDSLRTIVKNESVRGLYKGMPAPMAGVAAINAIVFGVYGNVQRSLNGSESLTSHFLAGSAAGFAQSVICSPMELIKTRLQLQKSGPNAYRNAWDCLLRIYKMEGLRKGLFKGTCATALRETPGFGAYFYVYEVMTRRDNPETVLSTATMLLAGGLAGTASWVITYPVDVIKSRLQADGINGKLKYTGAWDCFMKSVEKEGPRILTRGICSTIIRAFPTNAATFTVVTWVFRLASSAEEESILSEPRRKDYWTWEVKPLDESYLGRLFKQSGVLTSTNMMYLGSTCKGFDISPCFHEAVRKKWVNDQNASAGSQDCHVEMKVCDKSSIKTKSLKAEQQTKPNASNLKITSDFKPTNSKPRNKHNDNILNIPIAS